MVQSQSNGLEPSQPKLVDITTFSQDSIEHANEELMQERIQNKTIEDLIMIAQDPQAFVNDEDAIFETKIVSRKQDKSPMSIKNSKPASLQKVLAPKKKIATPMKASSLQTNNQLKPISPTPEPKTSELSQSIENAIVSENENMPPSPRRTIYQKQKYQDGAQVPPTSHLMESAYEPDNLEKPFQKTAKKESMISLHSHDLLIKNKDLSNLNVFIEKQTDPKANKVFAQVQIKMVETVGDANLRSSAAKLQPQQQTNIAVRGRGVAAVISQDHSTDREEKSQPVRVSQLSIVTQSQVDTNSIHVTGTKINESPKRSQLDLSIRSKRDSEISKTQQRQVESELMQSDKKINQVQMQNLKKYQRQKEHNISDQQLAVLYEMEEQQIRMEIETQKKSYKDDLPGKMPVTRSEDNSPMTVRTIIEKHKQPDETVNETQNFEPILFKEVPTDYLTQLNSYNDVESRKTDLKRQTQTMVEVQTKNLPKEHKVTKAEKPQRNWIQHPILLMDGSSQPIPMLSLIDQDGQSIDSMMIEQKAIIPKLALTKDFSTLRNQNKSHLAPSGIQQIMTSRNIGFKERKNTLPLLNKTNQNVETLLYTTERDTQHIDELNQTAGESEHEKNPSNSPQITKTVVFVTKKVQTKLQNPFNSQKQQSTAKVSEIKRSHSPALLNIFSPQQQMDQQRDRFLTHQQSNSKLKSPKNQINDLTPPKIRKSVFTHRKATLDAKSKSKLAKHDSLVEPEPKLKIALTPADIVTAARNDLKVLLPLQSEVPQESFEVETVIQQQVFRNQIL